MPQFSQEQQFHFQHLKKETIINVCNRDQCAKKVMSDSPGLVDFNIGQVNSVLNLPTRQVKFLRNSNHKRPVINSSHHRAS